MNNKDAKNVIYTLKIPKSPEILKMIIASNESNNFENEIVRTEREIDELVYKIYGITEKEQKIIEGNDV